jgi:hypothetical protein
VTRHVGGRYHHRVHLVVRYDGTFRAEHPMHTAILSRPVVNMDGRGER